MKKIFIAVFVLIAMIILIISCKPEIREPSPIAKGTVSLMVVRDDAPTNVKLTTEDNINLAGTYYPGRTGSSAVILLHMLDRDRHTYDRFAQELQTRGYHVLSIDSRGHGESDLNWKRFDDKEFNNMVLDAKAAKEFLLTKSIDQDKIHIIGASIGANIALIYSAQNPSIAKTVLLSPGIEYRGVDIESSASTHDRPLLVIAAKDDSYSLETADKIKELNPAAEINIYESGGHGTNLFESDIGLEEFLLDWLEK